MVFQAICGRLVVVCVVLADGAVAGGKGGGQEVARGREWEKDGMGWERVGEGRDVSAWKGRDERDGMRGTG